MFFATEKQFKDAEKVMTKFHRDKIKLKQRIITRKMTMHGNFEVNKSLCIDVSKLRASMVKDFKSHLKANQDHRSKSTSLPGQIPKDYFDSSKAIRE